MQRLALDIGLVRTGVAIGARVAREFGVFNSDDKLAIKIAKIIQDEDVDELIVGLPVRSAGEPGTATPQINDLINQIKTLCPDLKIVTTDEAYSTAQAKIDLEEMGLGVSETKQRVDAYAAMLILEQYNLSHLAEL